MATCCNPKCGHDITDVVKRACGEIVNGPTVAAKATTVQVVCPYCHTRCEYDCPKRRSLN